MPAKDELTFYTLRPYINVCVKKESNWLTYSKALFYRSKLEIHKYKTMERSMAQMQKLIDQFRDQETTTLEKMDFVFCTCYKMQWGVKIALAKNYQ